MNLSKNLFFYFLLFIYNTLGGQNFVDLASYGFQLAPNNRTENTLGDETDLTDMYWNVKLPYKRTNGDIILASLSSNIVNLKHSIVKSDDLQLQYHTLQLAYTKNWSEKWQTMIMYMPRLSSDCKDISGEDFQNAGLLMMIHNINPELKLKYAFYANNELPGLYLLPILGYEWLPTPKLSLFGNIPITSTIRYQFHEKFGAGLFLLGLTSSYRLSENKNSNYVQKFTMEATCFIETNITKNLIFWTGIGRSANRRYSEYNKDNRYDFKIMTAEFGEERIPINNGFANGWFYECKLLYRIFP